MASRATAASSRGSAAAQCSARSKSRQSSVLESVPGLGPSRRRSLLTHFGGLQGVVKAGVEDLMAVRGISRTLAETIYDHLHPGSR